VTMPSSHDALWYEHAACAGVAPDVFFPARGPQPHVARSDCAGCPVAADCLSLALENVEDEGIWGGTSERQRRRLRQLLRREGRHALGYRSGCTCRACTAAREMWGWLRRTYADDGTGRILDRAHGADCLRAGCRCRAGMDAAAAARAKQAS
jgi:hypothetical protein